MLTSEPVDAALLRAALGGDARDAEVLVVSPALQDSPLRFWMSDVDEAGVDAAGDTGESDPYQAVADALAAFPADRIVVFTHPEGQRAYLEDDFAQEAERRFGIPVVRSEVGR